MKLLGIEKDFRGGAKPYIGLCPYPKRSPLLLAFFNLQELWRYLRDARPTRGILSATRAIQSSKTGRRALVLGNGPSLNKLNSQAVRATKPDVWVVNSFYNAKCADFISVTHYVLSDRTYFTCKANAAKIVEFSSKQDAMTLVLPHWALKEFPDHVLFQIKHLFFDDRQKAAWSNNTSPIKPRGYLSLTLYKALAFANFLGYEEILILGMDNTEFMGYKSNFINEFIYNANHAFVDSKTSRNLSLDFLDGPAGAFVDVAHALADLYRFNGPIRNLDPDSLTTAFPKLRNHPWVSRQKS